MTTRLFLIIVLVLIPLDFGAEVAASSPSAIPVPPDSDYCSKEFLSGYWNRRNLGQSWYEGIVEDASRVCLCESEGNPEASRVDKWENSVGLFQINVRAWIEYKSLDLKNPDINAATAAAIFKRWGGWGAWSCAMCLRQETPIEYPTPEAPWE